MNEMLSLKVNLIKMNRRQGSLLRSGGRKMNEMFRLKLILIKMNWRQGSLLRLGGGRKMNEMFIYENEIVSELSLNVFGCRKGFGTRS